MLCYGEDADFVVVEIFRGVVDELEFLHYFVFIFAFVVRAGIYGYGASSSTISSAAFKGSNMASSSPSSLIGGNLSQHAAEIPSWTALFSLTSTQLRERGVEPPRSRRHLLWWREKFEMGNIGLGEL
jgi:IGR protein motif